MNDRDLEARLRAWYRAEAGEAEAAPLVLRQDVVAIPRTSPHGSRRFGRGRGLTLLAAAALLIVGGTLAAGSGLLRLPTVVPPVPDPSVIAVATASPDASSPSPSESAAPSASPIPVAGPGGALIATGTMGTPRSGNEAVRLLDGRVLVVGGSGADSDPPTAELYDPASGTWSATGSMLKGMAGFPPTLLRDGRVLVGDTDDISADVVIIGAEVYDPATGVWSSAGNLCTYEGYEFGRTATLLRDGQVLLVSQCGAQLYDPDSGTWSRAGKMITPRHEHTATLLPDGKVLVAGGSDGRGRGELGSAELYDPDTGSWTAIGKPIDTRRKCPSGDTTGGNPVVCESGYGWATLLPDGTLLLVPSGVSEFDAAVYDPTTETWTGLAGPTECGTPRALLSDGTVLITDLRDPCNELYPPCTAAALYDPRTGSSTTASNMPRCRSSFTLLLDGTVLVAGGRECNDDGVCGPTGAAELYVPAGVSPPPLPAFPSPAPPSFASPTPVPSTTPVPTPLPPTAGPVPPNARSWTVTVDNQSSEPATLFVADEDGDGLRLVGSATPNVVPAGATMRVTFLFPANDDGWIDVNRRPGDGGGLVNADQIGIPGKIVITADGQVGWLSP
jgi:hypothetical protein